MPSARTHWNCPAGQVVGVVQTPFTQLWLPPQTAHDAPQAVRFVECVEQPSSDPSARTHWNWPAGQVEGVAQRPLMQLWAAPQRVHDEPQAVRFVEWVEQASSNPSARAHWNCPAGHVEGVVQTPLMQLCAAPQTAQDEPQAVRFVEWVEQASSDPSARMHWNCPAGHVEGVVQTPSMQLWVLPQTAQDGPQAFRFDAWSEHASPVPSARVHTNCPAGHGEGGFVQTPFTQVCVAPQTAHDGPQAVRLIECVEQASRVPSGRAH